MNELGMLMLVVFVGLLAVIYFSRSNVKNTKDADVQSSDSSTGKEPVVEEKTKELHSPMPKPSVEPSLPEVQEGGKHFKLEVDEPAMNGEIPETMYPREEVKPSFGIPSKEPETKINDSVAKEEVEPEVFVLVIMNPKDTLTVKKLHETLQGVGAQLTDQGIYEKREKGANLPFIRIANVLEPGTFTTENPEEVFSPGVVLIMELPTIIHAPKAMHEFIMLSRKLSQHINGRIYDQQRSIVSESKLQSMRDKALRYESQAVV